MDRARFERRLADADDRVTLLLHLLAAAGRPVVAPARVLDFGCGLGAHVQRLRAKGFDAAGCDFADELGIDDALRCIEIPYRLPFDDDEFDAVVSDQVFEHVQEYQVALREIRRVLKPDGVSIHLFPPRYSLRESHTFVPFATVIQASWWLRLWAWAGIRNSFQVGKAAGEVASLNREYLRDRTIYLPRRQILREARTMFPDALLIDQQLLESRRSARARWLAATTGRFPVLAKVWGEVREHALLLERRGSGGTL